MLASRSDEISGSTGSYSLAPEGSGTGHTRGSTDDRNDTDPSDDRGDARSSGDRHDRLGHHVAESHDSGYRDVRPGMSRPSTSEVPQLQQ